MAGTLWCPLLPSLKAPNSMPWLELRIDSNRDDAPALEEALLTAGALSVTLQDNADQPIFEPALGETPLWQATRVTGLFEADVDTVKVERRLRLNQPHWHVVEDKDWEREWMQHYHPIQCGERLWICPSWLAPPDPTAVNLLLDPGLAFGTGNHETTRLCVERLVARAESTSHRGRVVDAGCGSGILALSAVRLGWTDVSGFDNDPEAVRVSEENAALNDLAGAVRFTVADLVSGLPDGTQADVVLANIQADVLLRFIPQLVNAIAPGGLLVLSGILARENDQVRAAYSAAAPGWRVEHRIMGEWSDVALFRPE